MDALRKAVDGREDAGRILSLSEKVLLVSPTNAFAIHCKAVAILQSGSAHKVSIAEECFQKLRSQVEEGSLSRSNIADILGLPNISALVFQHAYCMYRLNRYTEVISLLKGKSIYSGDASTFSSANLLAQAYYNSASYKEAAAIYDGLLLEAEDDEDKDHILTNLTACCAAIGDAKRCETVVRNADEKVFEYFLNSAIAATECNDSVGAKNLLNQAEQLLRRDAIANGATATTLEALEAATSAEASQLPNKEFASDFALILVHRAFIMQHFDGHLEEAERILSLVLNLRIGSQITASIAAVNIATIRSHAQFFDAYRTLKQVQSPSIFNRFNHQQRRVVLYNTALLLLNMNKIGDAKRIASQLAQEHAGWPAVATLLASVVIAETRGNASKAEAAIERLLVEAESKGDKTLSPKSLGRLIIAQVRLRSGNIAGAVATIETDATLMARSSVVATLCDLQAASGQLAKAATTIANQKPSQLSHSTVLRITELLIQSECHTQAIALLDSTSLATNESNALRALATTYLNTEAAVSLASRLDISSANSLQRELSEEEITSVVSRLPTRSELDVKGFVASANANTGQRTTNRRRPMRHPCKNLKPDAKVDYERWLPLSIRTYYKDLPERRKKEMRRLRREEQATKRKQAERRKAEGQTVV